MTDTKEVGRQIQPLRKIKNLTQCELGERLCVSAQAVSKWERGETLPDTALLPDLAAVLETSIDNILTAGRRTVNFRRRATMEQIAAGVECFVRLRELLGADNLFYIGAIEGVNARMNIELENCLTDPYTKEAMVAEAAVQCLQNGFDLDLSDIQKHFTHEHWRTVVTAYARKNDIR